MVKVGKTLHATPLNIFRFWGKGKWLKSEEYFMQHRFLFLFPFPFSFNRKVLQRRFLFLFPFPLFPLTEKYWCLISYWSFLAKSFAPKRQAKNITAISNKFKLIITNLILTCAKSGTSSCGGSVNDVNAIPSTRFIHCVSKIVAIEITVITCQILICSFNHSTNPLS